MVSGERAAGYLLAGVYLLIESSQVIRKWVHINRNGPGEQKYRSRTNS